MDAKTHSLRGREADPDAVVRMRTAVALETDEGPMRDAFNDALDALETSDGTVLIKTYYSDQVER